MKAVVSAWIGSNNLGDELIFMALLRLLDELGISRDDVTAITLNVKGTRETFGTRAVGHFDFLGQMQAIRQADVLIFGGGGLLQDETSIWNLPYHLSRVWLARLLRKPVVALGLGAGIIGLRLSGWLVRMTFGPSTPIAVRDEESLQVLRGIGIQHASQTADLVLSQPIVQHEPKGYIAVALRPFSQKRGWLPVHMRRQSDPKDPIQIAALLDQAARQTDLPVRFVSFDLDKDLTYHQLIAAHMSSDVSFVSPTVDHVTEVIGSANVVIGMRYHAAILAFLCGVPSILIGYSPKVQSLAKEATQGCKVIANDLKAFKTLPTLLEEVLNQGQNVAIARERLHAKALENIVSLRDFLSR